jgi:electron transfer flavoprotein alpha subunit
VSGGDERRRRDPFAERASRRGRGTEAPEREREQPAAGRRLRVIDHPACLVLAVPDLDDGRLSSHDRDLFGAARVLADGLEGAVLALVCAAEEAAPDLDLGAAGADRVVVGRHAGFAGYAPEARAAAVAEVVERLGPRHLLFPDSAAGGGDLGRRVAARLGERPAGNVQRLGPNTITRRGRGGRADFVLAPPRVLLIAEEAAEPATAECFEARPLDAIDIESEPRLTDRGLVATDPNVVPLAEADFIVSAGNGVRDWDAFHRLAAALGAAEGGSRVVCDSGRLGRERQVGSSGTLVEPRCYLALGIAGAPQHLQGIARCERVVAVNTDLHADMVKRADLAIIADAQAVMPALARLAEERRGDG